VHLVSSAQALRPQFINYIELRRRTRTERRRSTCTERSRSMVDVELLPPYHQSMHFGCAQCGGLRKFCVAFDCFFNI
jgi:hypothetical protein